LRQADGERIVALTERVVQLEDADKKKQRMIEILGQQVVTQGRVIRQLRARQTEKGWPEARKAA
jgi:hypothetical protein